MPLFEKHAASQLLELYQLKQTSPISLISTYSYFGVLLQIT